MRKRKKVEKKKVIKNISKNVPKNYNLTLRACARERRETLSGKPSRRVKKKNRKQVKQKRKEKTNKMCV